MKSELIALDRVRTESALHPYKRKLHILRRLVAGDMSAIDDTEATSADHEQTMPLYRESLTEFYDIMVTDIEDGRSNKLKHGIRTLLFQTVMQFPDVEVQNLAPELANLHSAYLRKALGAAPYGCEAKHQMQLALLDYMIGGMGWAHICLKEGAPSVKAVDTIDMVWDWSATLPNEITWAACKRRNPVSYWIKHFGSAKGFTDIISDADKNPDVPVELWFYYDLDGNHFVFRQGLDEQNTVFKGQNLYMTPTPAGDVPMLPFEPMYYLTLPGVKFATGVAEDMLPAQIAIWEGMRRVRDTITTQKPWVDMEEGAYNPEDLDDFRNGVFNPIMRRNSGKPPAVQMQGAQPETAVLDWIDRNQREIVEQSGVNPYASGNPIDVDYAAETNAIQQAAGLTAGVIAKDNAAFWERVVKKFLAVGRQYDDRPFRLSLDADTVLEFDESDPIAEYLDPTADIVIQEDTMSFRPRQQRIAEAAQDMQMAAQVAQMFPNAVAKAFENYLVASGKKNLAEWMKPPQMDVTQAAMTNTQGA